MVYKQWGKIIKFSWFIENSAFNDGLTEVAVSPAPDFAPA
jgi:hypothetical protein